MKELEKMIKQAQNKATTKVQINQPQSQQVFHPNNSAPLSQQISMPNNKSQAQSYPPQTKSPNQDSEDKLTELDNDLLIGVKPIVPHSCCYVLKPDNWYFFLKALIDIILKKIEKYIFNISKHKERSTHDCK